MPIAKRLESGFICGTMKSVAIYALILFSSIGFAADAEEAAEKTEPSTWEKVKDQSAKALDYTGDKLKEVGTALGQTQTHRAASAWSIHGNYSIFETWVMSKYGLTLGYVYSPSSVFELEYMRGSLGFSALGLDIGKIEEQRLSLLWRSYGKRNAFGLVMGLYYNKLEAYLGDELLKSVSGNSNAKIDLMELNTIGASWGLGNRWQSKRGFVWGADWFTIHVPLVTLKESTPYIDATNNSTDRDNAKSTFNTLKRIPEFAVAKIQLGFSW